MQTLHPGALGTDTSRTSRYEVVVPFIIFLIMITATVPWRSKTYYEGGADPVVLAKAALSLVGLGLAFLCGLGRRTNPVPAAPFLFLGGYLACTVLGSYAAGTLTAGAVVAVRVVILALTAGLLALSFDPQSLVGVLIAALGLFGLAGAISGLPTLAQGRLAGITPRLHPNELAMICGLVILWSVWRVINGRDSLAALAALLLAAAALVATGSRTPMLALVVSGLVLVTRAKAVRFRTAVAVAVLTPLLIWVLAGTEILRQLLLRDQSVEQVSSLSNRTIAWTAALGPKPSAWLEWLGGGLSMKQIAVPGQWWNTQILDSSWISAIVQAGWVGAAICVIWVISSLSRTPLSGPEFASFQQALIIYLVVRGVFESGLFDATTAFMVFFVSVLATPILRRAQTVDGYTTSQQV